MKAVRVPVLISEYSFGAGRVKIYDALSSERNAHAPAPQLSLAFAADQQNLSPNPQSEIALFAGPNWDSSEDVNFPLECGLVRPELANHRRTAG